MASIDSIRYRQVLNSHAAFTTEFELRLDDGACGLGASPQGETISIYEDRARASEAERVVAEVARDGYVGREVSQEQFDAYLNTRMQAFGRNTCYALSLAFADAVGTTAPPPSASAAHGPRRRVCASTS